MRNLKIVLDADDVLIKCNSYALEMLHKDSGKKFALEEITGWGAIGKAVDERLKYFNRLDFFKTQPAMEGASGFLKELMKIADVTIMSAVNPMFAGARMERLITLFPFFPTSQIVLGEKKDMIRADMILDDRVKNVMTSACTLPVLFRQPWNRKVSGICSVKNYGEFLTVTNYVREGRHPSAENRQKAVCIIGPGGSNKHLLQQMLCRDSRFIAIGHITTADCCGDGVRHVSDSEFDTAIREKRLAEYTWYDNYRYGTEKSDIDSIFRKGKVPVVIMDISGSLSFVRDFGSCVVFADRPKYESIKDILGKDLSKTQMADRIYNYDLEQKNKILADLVVDTSPEKIENSVEKITDFCIGRKNNGDNRSLF